MENHFSIITAICGTTALLAAGPLAQAGTCDDILANLNQARAAAAAATLSSDQAAQNQNVRLLEAGYGACLRVSNGNGAVPNTGANATTNRLNNLSNLAGSMANMMSVYESIESENAARREQQAAADAVLQNELAAQKAARDAIAKARDDQMRNGVGNPFGNPNSSAGGASDNPFADDANNRAEQFRRCNYGQGDQAACQYIDRAAAAERQAYSQQAFDARDADIKKGIKELQEMGRGGTTGAPAYPDMKAQTRARLSAAGFGAISGAPDGPSPVLAPNAISPSSVDAGRSPGAIGRRIGSTGIAGSDNDQAVPDGPTATLGQRARDTSNPFETDQAKQPQSMVLGDPKEADLPDRLNYTAEECAARQGDVISVPGNAYCVINTKWHHLITK